MKSFEAEALDVMDERKSPKIAKTLNDWAEEMLRAHIGIQGYPRQSPAQTIIDLNYDIDQDGKKRPPLPNTGKGLPCGKASQTRTRKSPTTHMSDEASLVETCIIYVCRYRPDLLNVLRAEYLNIVPHQGKLVRRPRDTVRTLTEYRTAMAPKLGLSERRWRQLLSEAHTAIACLFSLLDSGYTDIEQLRLSMRTEWIDLWGRNT